LCLPHDAPPLASAPRRLRHHFSNHRARLCLPHDAPPPASAPRRLHHHLSKLDFRFLRTFLKWFFPKTREKSNMDSVSRISEELTCRDGEEYGIAVCSTCVKQ